jgi:phosphoglycerate kinase
MKSTDDIEVTGRRVLVRSDLNVPLDKSGSGAISDDGRIRASLPVIKKLAGRGARVVVMAHLGRPKGEDFAERAARQAGRVRDRPGRAVGDHDRGGPVRR